MLEMDYILVVHVRTIESFDLVMPSINSGF